MVIGADVMTLSDIRSKLGKNDQISRILEMMARNDPFMRHMHWVMCNAGSEHEFTRRTQLPKSYARALNEYIPKGKDGVQKGKVSTASIDAWTEIDAQAVIGAAALGNGATLRTDLAQATIMGLGNDSAELMLYASLKKNPKHFNGFMAYYNHLSNDQSDIGYNVIDAGGTTDTKNCSILMITWSPKTVYGLYPKGGSYGIIKKLAKEISTSKNEDGDGKPVYNDWYFRNIGLCVEDWRSTVRIANIDMAELRAGNIDIADLLTDAYYTIPNSIRNIEGVNPIIYCPTPVAATITKQAKDKSNPIDVEKVDGKPIKNFWGYEIHECDSMLINEGRVVAA